MYSCAAADVLAGGRASWFSRMRTQPMALLREYRLRAGGGVSMPTAPVHSWMCIAWQPACWHRPSAAAGACSRGNRVVRVHMLMEASACSVCSQVEALRWKKATWATGAWRDQGDATPQCLMRSSACAADSVSLHVMAFGPASEVCCRCGHLHVPQEHLPGSSSIRAQYSEPERS